MRFNDVQLLNAVVLDYQNPIKIYELAREYDRLEQGAAAVGWYLRAAEFSEGETEDEKYLQYKCLILCALVFNRESGRHQTATGLLKMAITVMPQREEAYYFLAKMFKEHGNWRDGVMIATQGLNLPEQEKIDNDLSYEGIVTIKQLYAFCKWKSDGQDASKNGLFDMVHKEKFVPNNGIQAEIKGQLEEFGYPSTLAYNKKDINNYRFSFDGIETVDKNYSRHFQDMFVLSFLNGKQKGSFLEIGSGHPTLYNNTKLLEEKFNWRGISIDNSERMCSIFSRERNSTVILDNATYIDYDSLFKQHCLENNIDLLRINADHATLPALSLIPFKEYEFTIIQIQHNACWWGDDTVKDPSREILTALGYKLFVSNVAINENDGYEDWWVHPNFVNKNPNMLTQNSINFAWDYMMKGNK